MAETNAARESAAAWLLHSGIQEEGSDPRTRGGVHAWYDLPAGTFSFLYPEITGYYLTTLLYLHSLDPRKEYREHAMLGGEWLLREARDPQTGAFRCRLKDGEWLPRICAFDNGMCINGLTHLFRVTKEKKYLDAASEVATWLIATMQKPDGSFFPKYDADREAPWEEPDGKWSLRSSAYLTKLAIGFLNLADAASDARFTDAARLLCLFALTQQESDGRFRTDAVSEHTFVHPHCYAAEGLLVAGWTLKEQTFLDAARKAIAWILPHQLPTGGFPAFFENGKFLPIESPDISAQVLRLAFLCHAEPFDFAQGKLRPKPHHPLPHGIVTRCISRILSYQCHDQNRKAAGGFFSGDAWFHEEKNPVQRQHVNSWVTMFCTQALTLRIHQSSFKSHFLIV